MQVRPLVSIIIPIHNRFELAVESINTVLGQTYRPLQLIIVDDASDPQFIYTENLSVVQKGISLQIIRCNENVGPGSARELGRQQAQGEFIGYLDSDDLWHEQKIEKQIEKMLQDPTAGMCYCISSQFSETPLTGNKKIRKRSDQSFDEFLPTILDGRPWDTSACLWSRSASDTIGPWSSSWAWEDYEYDCRAGCQDIKVSHLDLILCYHRKNFGGAQLSAETGKIKLLQRAQSMLEMEYSLREFGKFSDPVIRKKMFRILYSQAFNLLYEQEKTNSKILMHKSADLQRGYKGITIKFLLLLFYIFPTRLLFKIFYRLRNFYL